MVDLARSVPTGTNGFPTAVQRTYTITPSAAGFTGTLRLHYLTWGIERQRSGDYQSLALRCRSSTHARLATSADVGDCAAGCTTNTSNFWAEATGVTTFSPWTMNSTAAPTATNGVITGRIVDEQRRSG